MQEVQLILVVDDTPANLAVTSEVLTDAGFEVAIAKDGERAIKQAERNLPNLILLDIMMPGIDGFETCRRLKASPITQEIPIIFMTALSDTTDKVMGFNLGGVDYITKPFQEAELLARVKTHLKLRHLTQNLEQQVAERTAELRATLQQLQQSQFQLIQSEKMATLGLLMAGVAHEINNPVNFIHGNLDHIEGYTQTLIEFIQLYQKHYPHPPTEIQEKAENEDLEFLQEDLLKIVSSIKMGSDRIREIVKTLRNFSRTDEVEVQAVDIHEGINSTLTILQHRLKAHCARPSIEVIKDYSALPPVECYPGPLNQAFMNILVNAIDALEDSFYGGFMNLKTPSISIRTSVIDTQWVEIAIADNGRGIPEQIKQRIFDPFFTTKPVNKGTGMGLSISYQIITDKHNGKLECFSTPEAGAEFVIQIPIQQC
ncbi:MULTISPECIES: sensor histidine kinase [Nostocales]|uniref:histidine kinase n=3 Tax=Nostocales TaxID=1161 RepID=A0A0C1RBH0_9CYAN|nr:response regulator [Tolypothrix bouteillei]KAF3884488.1 hybrid sensor histidine kinase/response regulator [Tolypothrix bouteillei VB521301]